VSEQPVKQVEQTLRRVSQLRTLFLQLPHLPSVREQQQVAEFRSFVAGHGDECSVEALEAGLRDAHRRLDAEAILAAARQTGAWLRSDPMLHPYIFWAEQFVRRSAVASRSAESPRE
jgi:hypothetical protein